MFKIRRLFLCDYCFSWLYGGVIYQGREQRDLTNLSRLKNENQLKPTQTNSNQIALALGKEDASHQHDRKHEG